MTNEQLDIAIDTAALLGSDNIDALLAERSARIAAAAAQREAHEAAWLAELDAEIAAAGAVVTVTLTASQADRLDQLLPESLLGLTLMASRVKGTREQLADALAYVDADAAVEIALPGFDCRTDEELAFAERAVRASVKALRRKLRDAIRA